jgi:hypothetical protein
MRRARRLIAYAKEVRALRSPEVVSGFGSPNSPPREVRRFELVLSAVALVLLVALAIPVALQNARILPTAASASPLHSGSDFTAVVAGVGRSRAQNAMIGIGVRAASSAGSHPIVYGPRHIRVLSMLPRDSFDGRVAPGVLHEALMQPFVDGKLVEREYQVQIPDSAIARFEAQGRLVRFPMDVWAVKPRPGQTVSAVVLHTDASGRHVVAVPIGESGVLEP